MARELSANEMAVRRAVEKTERQGKLSAARFKVDRAKARLKKLDDERGELRDAVEAAELELAVVEKLMKQPLIPQDTKPEAPVVEAPVVETPAAAPAVEDPLTI